MFPESHKCIKFTGNLYSDFKLMIDILSCTDVDKDFIDVTSKDFVTTHGIDDSIVQDFKAYHEISSEYERMSLQSSNFKSVVKHIKKCQKLLNTITSKIFNV